MWCCALQSFPELICSGYALQCVTVVAVCCSVLQSSPELIRGSSWSHVDIVEYQKEQERWNSKKRLTRKDFSGIDARQLHVAVCYSVLQRVAVGCSVLQRAAHGRGLLQNLYTAAACCSKLQCVAVCYLRERTSPELMRGSCFLPPVCCSVLQCVVAG